jgi:hypothetical protein
MGQSVKCGKLQYIQLRLSRSLSRRMIRTTEPGGVRVEFEHPRETFFATVSDL